MWGGREGVWGERGVWGGSGMRERTYPETVQSVLVVVSDVLQDTQQLRCPVICEGEDIHLPLQVMTAISVLTNTTPD